MTFSSMLSDCGKRSEMEWLVLATKLSLVILTQIKGNENGIKSKKAIEPIAIYNYVEFS